MKRIKIQNWDALVFFDGEYKQYTLTYAGVGGATVSDPNFMEAEIKFIEAMQLAESVGKLLHFKEHGVLQ